MMSITPGPSNLATLSISLNCGKQRAQRLTGSGTDATVKNWLDGLGLAK